MHSHCLGELAYFCGAKSVEYQPTSTLMGGQIWGQCRDKYNEQTAYNVL